MCKEWPDRNLIHSSDFVVNSVIISYVAEFPYNDTGEISKINDFLVYLIHIKEVKFFLARKDYPNQYYAMICILKPNFLSNVLNQQNFVLWKRVVDTSKCFYISSNYIKNAIDLSCASITLKMAVKARKEI